MNKEQILKALQAEGKNLLSEKSRIQRSESYEDNYISDFEIRSVAEGMVGLKDGEYSIQLIRELANMMEYDRNFKSGRSSLTKPSSWDIDSPEEESIRHHNKMVQSFLRTFPRFLLPEGPSVVKAAQAVALFQDMYDENTKEVIAPLLGPDYPVIPPFFDGDLPKTEQQSQSYNDGSGDGDEDEEQQQGNKGELFDQRETSEDGDSMMDKMMKTRFKELEEHLKRMDSLSEEEKRLLFEGYDPEGRIPMMSNKLKKLIEIGDFMKNKVGNLASGETKKVGGDPKVLKMSTYSEVSDITISEVSRPDLDLRLAQKKSRVRVKKGKTKNSIFILMDHSGSMQEADKLEIAYGIVKSRLLEVIKGNAEVYFAFYLDGIIGDIIEITTAEEAQEFYKGLIKKRINGGSTYIDMAIGNAKDYLRENNKDTQQIVVICDGQDYINPKTTVDPAVVHGFIIGQDNDDLKTVCTKSGGVFIKLPPYVQYLKDVKL